MKVDMAVSKAIDRVLDRIDNLDNGMNQRFVHLENRFTTFEHRVTSTKNSLRTMNRVLDQIRTKFIEYGFRAIAFTSGAVVLYALSQLRFLIK
jgi:hypothetical protein